MPTNRTIDRDLGRNRILRELRESAKLVVKVGWPEERAINHNGESITMAELAAIHEFGAPRAKIPERSTLRATVDKNRQTYRERIRSLFLDVIQGKMKARGALHLFGSIIERNVKEAITHFTTPDITEATKKRKGSSQPLIDTGAMRDAVTHVVVNK